MFAELLSTETRQCYLECDQSRWSRFGMRAWHMCTDI